MEQQILSFTEGDGWAQKRRCKQNYDQTKADGTFNLEILRYSNWVSGTKQHSEGEILCIYAGSKSSNLRKNYSGSLSYKIQLIW